MLGILAAIVAGAVALAPAVAGGECQQATKPVTELGTPQSDEQRLSASNRTARVGDVRGRHVRVLVEVHGEAAPWSLVVRDYRQRVVQAMKPSDFANSPRRWTIRVPNGLAWFDLYGGDGGSLEVRLLDYIVMPAEAAHPLYSSRDPNHPTYGPLYEPRIDAATRKLGDSVGLLTSSFGRASWCCSGTLVAADLFLTNWHCGGVDLSTPEEMWRPGVCANTLVDLSWDEDDIPREYQCQEVVEQDRSLDFAILRVAPIVPGSIDRPSVIADAPTAPGPVRIIHHPKCLSKQLTKGCDVLQGNRPNWLDTDGPPDAVHDCDTERGSSGAPLFDAAGRLVAVHHRGYDFDDACRPRAYENKAVRVADILAFLRRKHSTVVERLSVEGAR